MIDQWRVRINACVKTKAKHFEHMLWCAVPQLSIICYETYITVFLLHKFYPIMAFKVLALVLTCLMNLVL